MRQGHRIGHTAMPRFDDSNPRSDDAALAAAG
jgi:hypothetical protein